MTVTHPLCGQGFDPNAYWRCQQLVYSLYERYDRADYTAVANLFTPEGRWFRADTWLDGRAAIASALALRPRARRSAHLVNNLQVHQQSADAFALDYWLTVYRCDTSVKPGAPAAISGPAMLLSAKAEVVFVEQQPLFHAKALRREFVINGATQNLVAGQHA